MKTFFVISFCVISGVTLGTIASIAMMMTLAIDTSFGTYIGAVQGAVLGLLCSPFFILKRTLKHIFLIMVMCLVLSLPVALISGLTQGPWISIALTAVSYISIFYLLTKDDIPEENQLIRNKRIYVIPAICLIMASIIAYGKEDTSLPSDISSLIEMMGDNAIERQTAAARKLKTYGKGPFLTAINHKNPTVRATAAHFLGLLHDPSVQDILIKSSSDPDPYVRMWTAFSLGKVGDVKALPTLGILSGDKEEIVRQQANEAIQEIRKERGNR